MTVVLYQLLSHTCYQTTSCNESEPLLLPSAPPPDADPSPPPTRGGWRGRLSPGEGVPEEPGLEHWRAHTLQRILSTLLAFSLVALVPSVYACIATEAWSILALDLGSTALVALLWRWNSLAHRHRADALLVTLFVLSTTLLAEIGSQGAGFIWMGAFVGLAAVLRGRLRFLHAIGLATLTFAAFAARGHIAPQDVAPPHPQLMWGVLGGNTLLTAAAVGTALLAVVEGLSKSLHESTGLQQQLEAKQQHLLHVQETLLAEIEQRKAAEAREARAREQFQETEKLDALGRMANTLAHDLHQVLEPIQLRGAHLQSSLAAEDPNRADADALVESARQAVGLVRQTLAYAGPALADVRAVSVANMMERVATLVRAVAHPCTRLEVGDVPPQLYALADELLLFQTLANLALNGVQSFGNQPGHLRLTGGTGPPPELALPHRVQHGALGPIPPDWVWVLLTDTGPGMSLADAKSAFEPFVTTHRAEGRTGLGLPICVKRIVSMAGALTLATGEGQGTAVLVALPPSAAPIAPTREGPKAGLPPDSVPRLLVVDDEPRIRDVAKRMLRRTRVDLRLATSAADAIDILTVQGFEADIVLTDSRMPGASGEELAAQLQLLRPHLPVVLMSGNAWESDSPSLAKIGIRRVLPKPFTTADLHDTLSAVLGVPLQTSRKPTGARLQTQSTDAED